MAGYQLSGQVGTNWQLVTLAGFSGNNTSDMLLRDNTCGFQIYNVINNNIRGSASLGTVGLEWQVIGFGNFGSFGKTDMMLRDTPAPPSSARSG